jgi:hypothetical protein
MRLLLIMGEEGSVTYFFFFCATKTFVIFCQKFNFFKVIFQRQNFHFKSISQVYNYERPLF